MTGSLQEKNGKYYAVINLTDINGKRKQKWISTGYEIKGNKKKAEQFLRNTIKEFELKENLIPTDILFSDYVKYWLEKTKNDVDEITYQGYSSVVNSHIIPYFEAKKTKLDKMNRDIIQEYINIKHQNGRIDGKGGLAPKSLKIHRFLIGAVLGLAVENNILSSNPCEFVNLPKSQHREATFYTINQINRLFECIKDEPLCPLIYITVVYGLRRSEVLGLKWDSVDFEANLITIKHTVVKVSEIVEKDVTKTESSRRSYPIVPEIKSILLELKQKEENNRKLFGKEYIENNYVFKWDNGQTYSPDFISHKFLKLLKQNDLPHIRFHDLRHSCASLLIAKGFTLKDIQEWLGHSDFRITANIYAHLDNSRKMNIAQSMTNMFTV